MLDVLYEFPEHPDLVEFVVTADTVKHRTFQRAKKVFRPGAEPAAKKKVKRAPKKGRESA